MARRSIANLSVSLTARTRGLRRGLKNANKSLDSFKKRALNIKTALLGALAGAGVSLALKQQASAIDSIAKTSTRLNIPINKFVALQHAVQLTGGDLQGLETGLQRMTRRIGEAAKGGGPAAKALEDLGLNASELSKLDAGAQLEAIAAAMQGISNQSEFIAITQKIFDSEGVKAFANLLRGGVPLIRQAQQEVGKLGLTFTKVQAGRIETLNDNFFRLKQLTAGINRNILNIVSGPLLKMSEQLLGIATAGDSVGKKVGTAMATIVHWVGALLDKLEVLRAGLTVLKTGVLGAAGGASNFLGGGIERLQNGINLLLPTNVDFSSVFEPLQAIGDAFIAEAQKAGDDLNASIERIQTGANSKALNKGIQGLFEAPAPEQLEPVVDELRAGNKLIQLQTDTLMQVLRNPPATPATAG